MHFSLGLFLSTDELFGTLNMAHILTELSQFRNYYYYILLDIFTGIVTLSLLHTHLDYQL